MTNIKKRAERYYVLSKGVTYHARLSRYHGYIKGAEEQLQNDIKRLMNAAAETNNNALIEAAMILENEQEPEQSKRVC